MEIFVVMWFLYCLDAEALCSTILRHNPTIKQDRHSIVIKTDNETFIFNKAHVGYSVSTSNDGFAVYRKSWQEVQQECLRLDCIHRQAEEDRNCSASAEEEYQKVNAKLRGAKLAFDLITHQIGANYHYAPEKSPY